MEDPEDFDGVIPNSIKEQVMPNAQGSVSGADLFPGNANKGLFQQTIGGAVQCLLIGMSLLNTLGGNGVEQYVGIVLFGLPGRNQREFTGRHLGSACLRLRGAASPLPRVDLAVRE